MRKKEKQITKIRIFKTGARRDTSSGKLEYFGFMHPICDFSYSKYMQRHQKMSDGSMRNSNDWWGGFPDGVALQSLCRHVEDLKLIKSGYYVYKVRVEGQEITQATTMPVNKEGWVLTDLEEVLNAIRFNADAMKLSVIREKEDTKKAN